MSDRRPATPAAPAAGAPAATVTDPGVRLRSLIPAGGEVTAAAFDDVDFAARAPADRPYLVVNMVATVDGKATIANRTAQIGEAADRALFHRLRAQADAVMVGAETVRAERYGRLIRDPALRALRERRGLGEPLAVVVSASLLIDPATPLLADPASEVVVLTPSPDGALPAGVAARVHYLRRDAGAAPHLRPLLERLRSEHGVRTIVCEGGPTLNDVLLREGLVDELFLSTAPKIAGGAAALTIVAGSELPAPIELELLSLLEHDGHLFARYAVRR